MTETNNSSNGFVIKVYDNGNRYEGELKDGKYCGKGVKYYSNGTRYEGEFSDNLENGKVMYIIKKLANK